MDLFLCQFLLFQRFIGGSTYGCRHCRSGYLVVLHMDSSSRMGWIDRNRLDRSHHCCSYCTV